MISLNIVINSIILFGTIILFFSVVVCAVIILLRRSEIIKERSIVIVLIEIILFCVICSLSFCIEFKTNNEPPECKTFVSTKTFTNDEACVFLKSDFPRRGSTSINIAVKIELDGKEKEYGIDQITENTEIANGSVVLNMYNEHYDWGLFYYEREWREAVVPNLDTVIKRSIQR